MINERKARIRIDEEGCLEVVDPGYDSLELLKIIDPGFQIQQSELTGFTMPKFLQTREAGSGISINILDAIPEEELWIIHNEAMEEIRQGNYTPVEHKYEATILDIKTELAYRILSHCRLCGQLCGVDRTSGELGVCGLGIDSIVAHNFIHIAEEPPVNPSLLISLAGCGLKCRYCQQWDILDPNSVWGELLDDKIWAMLPTNGARSLSFIGGNPDESLYGILRFLSSAPQDWSLPIVWNCHGYGATETINLLDGIVDVYIPDFKYGNDKCGETLSKVQDYPDKAKKTISRMLSQKVPVIVRILVLPGHFNCCHFPVLDYLAGQNCEYLYVSVRDQYYPDWKISSQDGEMTRRPTLEEVIAVRRKAKKLGLSLIE